MSNQGLRTVTAYSRRKGPRAAGSNLRGQLTDRRRVAPWIREVDAALFTPHAVIGAIAAQEYMPPRSTRDFDVAVAAGDERSLAGNLVDAGYDDEGPLALEKPLTGRAYGAGRRGVDVIAIPNEWARSLIPAAEANRRHGLPVAPVEWVVALKLLAGRSHDASDIARMTGHLTDAQLAPVRSLTERLLGVDAVEDLDQLTAMGRAEYGG